MKQFREVFMKIVFMISACASILAILLICVFLFSNGIPAIAEIGAGDFLLGTTWKPLNDIFGIFPMIIGSLYVTAGAIIVGVPIGLLCAVFMARFCPPKIYSIMKPAVDLMAGIPSIVYGFFGILVIVPLVQDLFGGSGKGLKSIRCGFSTGRFWRAGKKCMTLSRCSCAALANALSGIILYSKGRLNHEPDSLSRGPGRPAGRHHGRRGGRTENVSGPASQ